MGRSYGLAEIDGTLTAFVYICYKSEEFEMRDNFVFIRTILLVPENEGFNC